MLAVQMNPLKSYRSALLLWAFILGALSHAYALEVPTWNPLTPMPTPRWDPGAAVLDGQVYVIGGEAKDGVTGAVEVYDPATNTWSSRAAMPTPRSGVATAVVNGQIYAIGGLTYTDYSSGGGNGLAHANVEVYDPATDTWTAKADLPKAVGESGVAVLDGQIYLIGGAEPRQDGGNVNRDDAFWQISQTLMYDPATDTWTEKTRSTAVKSLVAIPVDGQIYAIGGYSGLPFNAVPLLMVYDSATDTWTRKTSMPTRRGWPAAAVIDGQIYVIGGVDSRHSPILTTVEMYDPATDIWQSGVDLPQPWTGAAAAVVNGRIYLFGGAHEGRFVPTASVLSFNPNLPLVTTASQDLKAFAGTSTTVDIEINLALPTGAAVPNLALDLSDLGQSAPFPLQHQGDGVYTGQPQIVPPAQNGTISLPVRIALAGQPFESYSHFDLAVFPTETLSFFAEDLADEWQWVANSRLSFAAGTFEGQPALALEATGTWSLTWTSPELVAPFGYALAFSFHPGTATAPEGRRPRLRVNSLPQVETPDLLEQVSLDTPSWQTVHLPVEDFALNSGQLLEGFRLNGALEGTFYLANLRLVPMLKPSDLSSVVLETHQDNAPADFHLDQNYPNPFNSGTVIRFALPQQQGVDLAIYNLVGQKVVQLVEGLRAAGQYSVHWDGRDAAGRSLATGLYLYRLQAGSAVETRKLIMAR